MPALPPNPILVLGVGAFTQGCLKALRRSGAEVRGYLTRDYSHFGPQSEAPCKTAAEVPNPCPWIRELQPSVVIPMSIEWALKPWTEEFLSLGVPFLCATGEALRLERERDFARELCRQNGIPFPRSFLAPNRQSALDWVRHQNRPFVIKNPLCSPTSPIHTIVCESTAETLAWIPRLDDAEGIFLQEYLGRREAGHIAFVSGGEIHSLVTNQEYKRAFDGNLGIVAGAPLGGLVERDETDRYHLAKELLHPLLPWFRQVQFHGPVQVTAILHENRWHVIEYNVRLGVTSGPMILRLLQNPIETLQACARNQPLNPQWIPNLRFGCNLTLAGYGYPYVELSGPRVPISFTGEPTCDILWGEVAQPESQGPLETTGHRLCDVAALGSTLQEAIDSAYCNIRKIRSLGSYYRTDVGQSLWPPGNE